MSKTTPRVYLRVFEVLGLYAFAVAQPLFELLGRNTPLLIHHRFDAVDLWLLTGILGVVLPGVLIGAMLVVGGWMSERHQQRFHSVVLALLGMLLALGTLRWMGDPLPGVFGLVGAAIVGIGGAWCLERRPTWRLFPRLLALALPISMFLFLRAPGIVGLIDSTTAELPESHSPNDATVPDDIPDIDAPIVFVLFDELPLLSLLDANREIDASALPNMAALADDSTWYRNATTVWSHTSYSVVSILTGRVATLEQAPTRAEYPHNLLSWLAGSHELRVNERVTKLAPPVAQELTPPPPRNHRFAALLNDLRVVYLHLVTPPSLAKGLPPIGSRWGGFTPTAQGAGGPSEDAPPWAFALHNPRAENFARFVDGLEAAEEPRLYFLHSMLPHLPARFLPSGKVYGGRSVHGSVAESWLEDEDFVREVYQRHLLQVGYVDHLLGQLVARLRELDLYDRTLLVVTSDHGASHWPGQARREPMETEHPQDIWRIPLLIKAPYQETGKVDDRNVQSIDILPTMAGLLGQDLPFPVEGHSAANVNFEPREFKVLREPTGERLEGPGAWDLDAASLKRKLELFDPESGMYRWVRHGPYRELIGRSVEEISKVVDQEVASESSCQAELDQLPVLRAYDPTEIYAPAQWTGALHCSVSPQVDALALVSRGRIQGIASLRSGSDDEKLFSGMIPEAVLRPGDNEARLLLIERKDGDARLRELTLIPSED